MKKAAANGLNAIYRKFARFEWDFYHPGEPVTDVQLDAYFGSARHWDDRCEGRFSAMLEEYGALEATVRQ